MATLYCTVFIEAGSTAHGDPLQEFNVNVIGTSTQSVALTASPGNPVRVVRAYSDADCFITWGSDPTAASGSARPVGADNPEYWHIKAGDKIAVITRA